MQKEYCLFLYSHSEYSDIWNLTFGQIKKHINLDEIDVIFCVDKLNNYELDPRIKIILYNNNLCYTNRILTTITKLQYEYIIIK